ncbi:alpha-glucosidase II precursor [Ceraceosorus guamensis]|uniref:Alpha-glucosidase II n=1 Tax=Ceraceosorus guamensis TaxID=1522189 RepID=A0A316VZ48_9BASI|nr:alpha-glucosidase II precursor [Ceraceosorus guamensis]PWN41673.1 alpha-glucosidase II precursor [Ceraceosorus guamensis]
MSSAGGRVGSLRRSMVVLQLLFALFVFLLLASPSSAVREHDFKKCADSSFCRRIRRLSSLPEHASPYALSSQPLYHPEDSTVTARVFNALHTNISFDLQLDILEDGSTRVRLDEVGQTYNDLRRYDQAHQYAIENKPRPAAADSVSFEQTDMHTRIKYGPETEYLIDLTHVPLKLSFFRHGVEQVVLNGRGLLHMEHFRAKPDPFPTPQVEAAKEGAETSEEEQAAETEPESQLILQRKRDLIQAGHSQTNADVWSGLEQEDSGEWEESWQGKPDSKPRGPEALSLDIAFPKKPFAFGLPEHASPLNLKNTRGEADEDFTDPYRLMNTDVFEYDYDSPMSLYGSVPVLHAQGNEQQGAASVFWLNGAETWIDISRSGKAGPEQTLDTHFFSESGVLDLFVYLHQDPADNIKAFSKLVGRTALPQYFAMGYHQSRWNYLTTQDVLDVSKEFSDQDIPMDVMWLDIEYSKDHMYMIWDDLNFPDPERMISGLDAEGRKLVIIVDPHFKRTNDYYVYKESKALDILVKTPDGKGEYEGWCWSGSASWIDAFNPKSWDWWSGLFRLKLKKLRANARNVHIWNDMQEPAIFNGPEITSPKDVIHHGGWEHRHLHNINGVLFQNITAKALIEREDPPRRPFVLARSWWVGTQKYGATWTGDNLGTWEHLAVSVPMILANNVGGMSFTGADIGGFFGNPEADMLVRWYQAGIFEPFFRAHAHIDTKRREPFLLAEPERSHVRDLIKLRYKMLPIWYTAFKENKATGLPLLRPQFLMFPQDVNGAGIGDQYYLADSGLLVKPAVTKDATSVDVYLGEDEVYYNYFTRDVYHGSASGKTASVPAPLNEQLPLLQRGGSILPLRERVRRSAELGWRDPLTLVVALNNGKASKDKLRATGNLYLDDGQTYDHEQGSFVWRRFSAMKNTERAGFVLRSVDEAALRASTASSTDTLQIPANYSPSENAFAKSIEDVRVEKIIVIGLEKKPSKILKQNGSEVRFVWNAGTAATASASKLPGVAPGKASELIIKDPALLIITDWQLEIVA